MSFGNMVARQIANELHTGFQVRFCERLYHGPARWFDRNWHRHSGAVNGDSRGILTREPGVTGAINRAHEKPHYLDPIGTFMTNCNNAECTRRVWSLHSVTGSDVTNPLLYQRELETTQRAFAEGRVNDLPDTCPRCRRKAFTYPITPLLNRWVYVLYEEGDHLVPAHEVHIGEDPATGAIYSHLQGGQFTDRGRRLFEGYLVLHRPASHTWHFFLSPVRLGSRALDLLRRVPQLQSDYDRARGNGHEADYDVHVVPELQPWATTVKRRFNSQQIQDGMEFIPLVDPFSWAGQIADVDMLPMLHAQLKILRDSDEQSKAFICSVLAQAIGRRQVPDSNPPAYETDSWDVRDDTVDPPSEFSSSGNAAQAWIDRYQRAVEYLDGQVGRAVGRLVFVLRYALGHRIVEVGCQERHGAVDEGVSPLSIGVAHWAHVLHDLQCGRAGRAYMEYLVQHGDNRERIPQANVLRGENARAVIARDQSRGLFAQVLAQCSSSIIASQNNAASRIAEALNGIDVQATTLGVKDLQGAYGTVFGIAIAATDKYLERARAGDSVEESLRECRLTDRRERLQTVADVGELYAVVSLLNAFKDYGQEGRRDENSWDAFGRGRAYGETPIKALEFSMKQGRRALESSFSESEQALISRLNSGATIAALETGEYEVLLASRSVGAFRVMGTGLRLVAGPVGLITGGMDLVSESAQTRLSWRNGDTGAATSHGIQAVGAVLGVAVAAAEVAALLSGAAAAGWAGPVGWIAAGLMLLGAAVMAWCSRNDLELFGTHCFIGNDYGQGDWDDATGKAWMAGLRYPELRYRGPGHDAPDRWDRQRLALLRMLSGFKLFFSFTVNGCGYIFPGFLTSTSVFEVEVEFYHNDDEPAPPTTRRGRSIALARAPRGGNGEVRVNDREMSFVVSFRDNKVSSILVLAEADWTGDQKHRLKVRLDLDGGHHTFLPASRSWVTCGRYRLGTGLLISRGDSAEVD